MAMAQVWHCVAAVHRRLLAPALRFRCAPFRAPTVDCRHDARARVARGMSGHHERGVGGTADGSVVQDRRRATTDARYGEGRRCGRARRGSRPAQPDGALLRVDVGSARDGERVVLRLVATERPGTCATFAAGAFDYRGVRGFPPARTTWRCATACCSRTAGCASRRWAGGRSPCSSATQRAKRLGRAEHGLIFRRRRSSLQHLFGLSSGVMRPPSPQAPAPRPVSPPAAAAAMRAAIRLAGGREVCFVCTLDDDGVVQTARVVARGDVAQRARAAGLRAPRRDAAAQPSRPGCSSRRAPTTTSPRACTTTASASASSTTTRRALYVVVEVPRAPSTTPPRSRRGGARPRPRRRRSRGSTRATRIARASARWPRPSRASTTTAASACSRRARASASRSATSCRRCAGPRRTASARSSPPTRSTCRSSSSARTFPFSRRRCSDQKVRFALLKGWRNYLCLARLEQARGGAAQLFEDGMAAELATLAAWAERTHDGSLADLPTPPRPEVWDEVSAEADLCTRMKCSHFDQCFVFKARRAAAQADVIVVNHHLLLADLAVRRAAQNWDDAAVLPAYGAARGGRGASSGGRRGHAPRRDGDAPRRSQRLLNRLDRRGKGLLPALATRLSREQRPAEHREPRPRGGAARARGARGCARRARSCSTCSTRSSRRAGQPVVRLTDDFATHPIWTAGLTLALEDTLGEIELLRRGPAARARAHRGEHERSTSSSRRC